MGVGVVMLNFFTLRTDFYSVISWFALLFVGYFLIFRYVIDNQINNYILIGAFLRVLLLFAIPNLSDDIYRFIWDGNLIVYGVNPYMVVPNDYLEVLHVVDNDTMFLLSEMNSPNYFSVYPPVLQGLFAFSVSLFDTSILGNVVVFKSFILLAEIGSILCIKQLLTYFKLPARNVLLYALNPLIIVELVGNVHFEALFIFFLLLSLCLLTYKKMVPAAVAFALAVGTKLLPLMLLPLLFKQIGVKNALIFSGVVGVCVVVLFLPFLSIDVAQNIGQSLELYFQTFEFNASVYYVLRWIGFQVTGYNAIATIGKILPVLVVMGIGYLSIKKQPQSGVVLMEHMLFAFALYVLLSSIVHPWYIAPLIALSSFTSYKFALVWSAVIPLSYFAYQFSDYHENYGLITAEYLLVFGWMAFELFKYRSKTSTL